ncbi:MAG: PEP/pyruvate-binding domain-containing protein [Deltaproteobacteria bacterium]|nr:PEP/pyruvate-binding domain-containing protein [Deltaproteobacteria bacterium]
MKTQRWVLWFEELGQGDVKRGGAKCANLGELDRIGMPVPPGFVVTTEAYDSFLKQTNGGTEINECLNMLARKPKGITEYEELSQRLWQIIIEKEIPNEIQHSISQAYAALGRKCEVLDVPVAVRSSGVAEDLPTAAFAGQYESFLGVKGKRNLLNKVKECWASLFTARAISYRMQNKLPILAGLMGVIVQRTINARSAGVAFTMLPSTGDASWIMIEANWGTAESVVQGIVAPDRYYINKETLEIEEKNVAKKLKQISLTKAGTMEEKIPLHKQSAPCVLDEELAKIAEMARQVEQHYGSPQDIEWVIEQDMPFPKNIFLVQTRPLSAVQKKSPVDKAADLICSRFLGLK